MQIFQLIRDYDRRKNWTNARRYTCLSWRSPVYVSSNHPVIRCNFIQASTHSRHPVCPHSMTPVCRSQNFSGLQPWTCNETVPRSHPIFFPTWSKHRLFFSRSNRLFSSPIGTFSPSLSLFTETRETRTFSMRDHGEILSVGATTKNKPARGIIMTKSLARSRSRANSIESKRRTARSSFPSADRDIVER